MTPFVDDSSARASYVARLILNSSFCHQSSRLYSLTGLNCSAPRDNHSVNAQSGSGQLYYSMISASPATRPRLEIISFHSATTSSHAGPSSIPRNILTTLSTQNTVGLRPIDTTQNSFNILFNPHLNSTIPMIWISTCILLSSPVIFPAAAYHILSLHSAYHILDILKIYTRTRLLTTAY
jgi:hypothetical protein